jgi:hypothetical protein
MLFTRLLSPVVIIQFVVVGLADCPVYIFEVSRIFFEILAAYNLTVERIDC